MLTRSKSTLVFLGLAISFGTASLAGDETPQLVGKTAVERHLAGTDSHGPSHAEDEILVRFKAGVSHSAVASIHTFMWARVLKNFRIVEGLQRVKLPPGMAVDEAIAAYRQRPEVLYAEPNYRVETLATPNDPSFGSLWGLEKIDAPQAWDISTGSDSAVVAVIDTGIDYNHADLSANMFRNVADCNHNSVDDDGNGYVDDCFGIDTVNNDSDPLDDHGHGTHVAGTIAAVGNNGTGVVGVNWNLRVMACKFLNSSGSGFLSGALECLEYVQRMKDRGVDIVATNNSWGGGGFSQALYDAIKTHLQRGILFIAAAGNRAADNDASPVYPASYDLPNIISVAATDRFDGLAFFSNFGRRTVHLGAPGHEIVSTTPGNRYATFSGTSMAAPHVTGVAALLKAADPSRDWRAVKNLILAGGDSLPSTAATITQKRLNAFGSLTCSDSPVFTRLKPIAANLIGEIGVEIDLAALNVNCSIPNGAVDVVINPGGGVITLRDDGIDSDQSPADGIYSGRFIPPDNGSFTLTFPDGDVVSVEVLPPKLSVTPISQDFGKISVGSSVEKSFIVRNVGGGVLSGKASTAAPFSISAGASYELAPNQVQTVAVRFTPTSADAFVGNVLFTGGGELSRSVSGVGVACSETAIGFGETRSGTLSEADCPAPHRPGSFGDLYTFAAAAGQQIRITMSSPVFYSALYLMDPSGNVLAWNHNCSGAGHDACIPWNAMSGGSLTLPSNGTYTIEATSYFSGATGDYSVYLTLADAPQRLTVTRIGTGTGTVMSHPVGINCGGDCTAEFGGGQVVNLRAIPSPDSIFVGWSGACSGSSNYCNVTMTTNKSVAATFIVPLTVAPSPLPEAEVGLAYSIPLISGGLPPYSIALVKGALPPGLSMGSLNGRLEGVPETFKGGSFTIRVVDRLGTSMTRNLKMKIFKSIAITTEGLKTGVVGKNYSIALKTTGGRKPFSWSMASGTLPGGLSLDSSKGKITGIPSAPGTTEVTFQVTDSLGGISQRTLALSIQ